MTDLTQAPYYLAGEQIDLVNRIVNEMTIDQKIGQLFFLIGPAGEANDIDAFIQKYQPGGIMYRSGVKQEIQYQINLIQASSKLPTFIAANLESGGNGIITEGTWVGTPMQVAATGKERYAFALGEIAGQEAAGVGVNMAFSPIADIDLNFRNPITNTRTFGSDAETVLAMTKAEINGFESSQVIPVVKHFPGDGVDERDQHLLSSINSLSVEAWNDSYGKIYQELIQEGLSSIMIGHILLPEWERKLQPGIGDHELLPASASKTLIEGLLRGELSFNGVAITDATPMMGYNTAMKRANLLVTTINAGIDMILFNKNIDEDYYYVKTGIQKGQISLERINEAVTRIVGLKVAKGLFGSKENTGSEKNSEPLAIVKEIADQSITLVKDREKLLPLSAKRYPKIRLVVLGDQENGGFKEGGEVGAAFTKILQAEGFAVERYDRGRLDFHEIFEEGVADLQQKFDLAIYLANVETASNQTTTRLDWVHLMAADAPWFMRDIPTIFISTANPYHLFDVPAVSTFINAYTGNQTTLAALAEKLTGRSSFKGISPVDVTCGDPIAKIK